MRQGVFSREAASWELLAAASIVLLTLDSRGTVVWAEGAVEQISGWTVEGILGRQFADFVAPEYRPVTLERFRKLLAGKLKVCSVSLMILDRENRRTGFRCTSRAFRDTAGDACVEIAGYPCPLLEEQLLARGEGVPAPILTPRQLEVLRLLGEGFSTGAIASRLTISVETTRNHVRRVLRELDCHSRLEAVAKGRRLGLI